MTGGGWLRAWPVRMPPLVDLLCFAGAGAGASAFAGWSGAVPAHAALLACQLPGREERIAEPPPATLGEAADNVAAAVLAARPGGASSGAVRAQHGWHAGLRGCGTARRRGA